MLLYGCIADVHGPVPLVRKISSPNVLPGILLVHQNIFGTHHRTDIIGLLVVLENGTPQDLNGLVILANPHRRQGGGLSHLRDEGGGSSRRRTAGHQGGRRHVTALRDLAKVGSVTFVLM